MNYNMRDWRRSNVSVFQTEVPVAESGSRSKLSRVSYSLVLWCVAYAQTGVQISTPAHQSLRCINRHNKTY